MNTHSRRFALPAAVTVLLAGTLAIAAPAQAASSTVNNFGQLSTAASAATCTDGDVITIGQNVNESGGVLTTGCDLTIDLNDRFISVSNVVVSPGTTLTIKDGAAGQGSLGTSPPPLSAEAGIRTEGAHLVIDGGTIFASAYIPRGPGPLGGAGIGGRANSDATAGTVTVNGGVVTARGGLGAAGIGGANRQRGGLVTVNGGSVTSYGSLSGSGIGGGANAAGGTTTVTGGVVTATGGPSGAGIGGGSDGNGGTTTVRAGARVVAQGGPQAPGIGAGAGGGDPTPRDGGTTVIEAGGDVNASSGQQFSGQPDSVSVIGPGATTLVTPTFGSLTVSGTLRIPAGNSLIVPDGATATITSTGIVTGVTGTDDGGRLLGPGTIVNGGTILLPDAQVVDATSPATVTDHHYAVTFDTQGGSTAPSPVTVFAASFTDAGRTFPAAPTKPGTEFRGWNSQADGSGIPISATSTLPGTATGGALTVTAYAQFVAPAQPVPPAQPGVSPSASVTGDAREGRTLTAGPGLPAGTAVTYRWTADGRTIKGATGQTLKLGKKQAARRVTVTVTAGGHASTSRPTKVVASKKARLVVTPTRVGKRDFFRVTAVGLRKNQKIRVWLGGRRVTIGKADARGVVDRNVRFSARTDAGKRLVRVSGYSKDDRRTYTITRTIRYLSR